jgi:lipopolysaccharide transport system permease protein
MWHSSNVRRPLTSLLRPSSLVRDLWRSRELLVELSKRDVLGRYKGAHLGLVWSVLLPLLMLAVYTFVFGVVFQTRWGVTENESRLEFALTMFCGMIAYQIFAESIVRAPMLITGNKSYVRKVVFPLEVLPVSAVACAMFHFLVKLAVLLLAVGLCLQTISIHWICLPLVVLPAVFMAMGFSWFLASVGVYLRDVGQAVTVLVQVLYFLTPVFYPVRRVPAALRPIVMANPLAEVAIDIRRVVVWQRWPDWPMWALMVVVTAVMAQLGYAWFMKTKRGFADVL